ncbi:LysM peptidoglycan-binding domain-containing protein [Thermodesulfobacteriota bacterium]
MRSPLSIRENIYYISMSILTVIFTLHYPCIAQEKDEEETYSISLVQTAEMDREIHEIDGKKVLTESYSVKDGDYLWQIMRDRGLLKKRNFNEILSALKKLNSSLTNLNLIHPEDKIIIPLVISPIEGAPALAKTSPPTTVSLETIKDFDLKYYTIKPGDSLIKVIKDLYDIPNENLFDEYMDLLKNVNPSIRDINTIYPGQKVRIPIYSPKVVRLPIKPAPPAPGPGAEARKEDLKKIGRQLEEIFSMIGEEWVQKGKHFIPLKIGGQITLSADSYPIIGLGSGNRVIVDLYNDLPDKMAGLITSSWDNYKIVHLEMSDNLNSAIEKIIPLCDYSKIHGADEPLIIGGDIPLLITADWIIKLAPEPLSEKRNIIIVNLYDDKSARTPNTIITFLKNLGIKTVDYPPISEKIDESKEETEILETGDDISSLIEMLLNLSGRSFSSKEEIPIYQGKKTGFNLIIKADFLFNIDGRDCIIDVSGLGSDIIALLREHQFLVLSITDVKSSFEIVSRTLNFLGVEFDSKPHPFLTSNRDRSKNIRLMIQGIIFRDNNSQIIFATDIRLPLEIVNFLSSKGYRILRLPIS